MLRTMPFKLLLRLAGVLSLALAAGCSTSSGLPQDRADRFVGDTIFNITGPDAGDPALQNLAHQLCDEREYDLTPVGFQIQPKTNALTEVGHADPRFAGGHGPITFADPGINIQGNVSFAVFSNDATVTQLTMSTNFDVKQAQNAVNTPGVAFAVSWIIKFSLNGVQHEVDANQLLRGVDFRST